MLTARGWWLLLICLLVLLLGLLVWQPVLPLLSLTLLLWFLGQWLLFAIRARLVVQRVTVTRQVRDERGPVETLWAGRSFEVWLRVRLEHPLGLPHVAVADWVPFGVEHAGGDTACDGSLTPDQALEVTYRIHCPSVAGPVRFEGVRLQVADFQGFFFYSLFVTNVALYRVLPVLTDDKGHAATSKRRNLLPPPGVHRLRSPGSGSELLDLRDYLPGDPPRTIAWKVSARRDRLITKEFESEVPLRCTLFVDVSNSVRVGPPGKNPLSRPLHISAAVAQANAAARDLTGLCLFDEQQTTLLRPARTPRHLALLLNHLADAASLVPSTTQTPVATLLPLAHAFAQEVYPHLLRPEINRVPFWLPWLWALPADIAQPPTATVRIYRWLTWLVSLVPFTLFALLLATLLDAGYDTWPESFVVPPLWTFGAILLWVLIVYPDLLAVSRCLFSRLFSQSQRRVARWRKQMAALLSVRHGLGPGGLALLLEDDEQCSLHLQRFLAEHHVPCTLPLYNAEGRYLFAAPGKVDVLGHALLEAVGKGRDNELFVLLVDLLELDDELMPLLRAVRVALARHHQVLVVCPWPPGLPAPGKAAAARRSGRTGPHAALLPLLDQAATLRYQAAYQRVRRAFARLGVPMVCAATEEPVPLILDRLERLRMLGRKR